MSSLPLLLFAEDDEDDEDDAFLFRLALQKAGVLNPVSGAGSYADRTQHPLACVLELI